MTAVVREWGGGSWSQPPDDGGGHEATLLRLAIDKAQMRLGWHPRWDFDHTVRRTVEWYRDHDGGADMAARTVAQIAEYSASELPAPAARV